MECATEHYWVKHGPDTNWVEVTRAEWIRVEREAGFYPKGMQPGQIGHWEVCATAGFSSSYPHEPHRYLAGKITRGTDPP
jgi:hypothetical protein